MARIFALASLLVVILFAHATEARAVELDAELERLRLNIEELDHLAKYAEAMKVAERYVALARKKSGDQRAPILPLNMLAGLTERTGQYERTATIYKQVVAIYDKIPGNEYGLPYAHADLGRAYRLLSRYADAERHYTRAMDYNLANGIRAGVTLDVLFRDLVKVSYRLALQDPAQIQRLARRTFWVAQHGRDSPIGRAFSQVAARAGSSPALAALLRERDDLVEEEMRLRLKNWSAETLPLESRDRAAEAANSERISGLMSTVRTLDKRLAEEFPESKARPRPIPLQVEEVQAQLRDDEALVLTFDTPEAFPIPEETFVWVVTKTDLRWLHSDLGTSELSGLVSDLQCGLIAAAWYDDAGAESCRAVLGAAPRRDVADNVLAETLPFDLARAHALYKELFGQAEDLIRNKRLIVVPSRALAQLPLQVLVTGLSDPEAARPRAKQVTRLGAELLDIQEDARRQLRLRPNEGVLVHRPVVGGPADRAGVRAYDVLLSISGTSVASVEAATKFIRSLTPQTKVVLRLLRADKENQIKEIQITVTAEAWTYWEWTPHIVDAAGLRNVSWLARSHSTMILPTVDSLSALRRFAKPSAATKPMIGFGNPLLDGNPRERPWEAGWAAEARAKQVCDVTAGQQTAHVARRLRTVDRMTIRGGRVDIDALRSQVPLPDTADELCVSASILKLTSADVVLGSNATETMVKRLSAEGRLADYRILHFATHGALAGEIENVNEPGLILTPPTEQSEGDDGYLSASEITKLKLDANLVILSACNTAVVSEGAAGDNNNWRESEAQLGLAFAFFHAGARALLVSNWAVDSAATVKLVTGTVEADARTADVGRAEALRRAMLAMIDNGEERDAHPSLWAPFVVFGEGAPYR